MPLRWKAIMLAIAAFGFGVVLFVDPFISILNLVCMIYWIVTIWMEDQS
jgi:uncharacterized membrane protein HdeD (DUF308 family)